mmetsp:Transcript_25318/g.41879  ORF Transcript_25318/g.41879 Transcript_25318/m.41879 type:complete len:233 (+) Transcript_25318:53-751(+)
MDLNSDESSDESESRVDGDAHLTVDGDVDVLAVEGEGTDLSTGKSSTSEQDTTLLSSVIDVSDPVGEQWECLTCTLINEGSARHCCACGTKLELVDAEEDLFHDAWFVDPLVDAEKSRAERLATARETENLQAEGLTLLEQLQAEDAAQKKMLDKAKRESSRVQHAEGCMVCGSWAELVDNPMLVCDKRRKKGRKMELCCNNLCHLQCCTPPLSVVPEGSWYCATCRAPTTR